MKNSSGKVLVLFGPHSPNLDKVAQEISRSGSGFNILDIDSIFLDVLQKTSHQYFEKETEIIQSISGKNFCHYLHMLSYAQKTNIPEIRAIFKKFYSKVQSLNHIIIYKFYEQLYFAVQSLLKQGKNCVFIHNFYFSPYPHRADIFLQFFKMFGENFKSFHIYTPMHQAARSLRADNSKFIEYLSRSPDADFAYKTLQSGSSCKNICPEPYLPFLLLSEYSSYYRFSRKILSSPIFEQITRLEMKEILESIVKDSKHLFGSIVEHSYPLFYPKPSRLENPKKVSSFSHPPKITYISGSDRSKGDFSLTIPPLRSSTSQTLLTLCPEVQKWINSDCTDRPLSKRLKKEKWGRQPLRQRLMKELKRFTLNSPSHLQKRSSPTLFSIDLRKILPRDIITDLLQFSKSEFTLLADSSKIEYEIAQLPGGIFKLFYKSKSNPKATTTESHLEVLNHLYIELSKSLNQHVFIDCTKENGIQ